MHKYKIIHDDNANEFSIAVTQALNDGWKLHGYPTCVGRLYVSKEIEMDFHGETIHKTTVYIWSQAVIMTTTE